VDHQAFAEMLGNYGEFIGALAVVITLAYLAVQVRYSRESLDANTRAMDENRALARADTVRQATRRWDEVTRRASENMELASVFVRGSKDLSDLNEVEQFVFYNQLVPIFSHHLTAHEMSREGFLDAEIVSAIDQIVGDMLRENVGARSYWEAVEESFPRDHRARVSELISKGCRSTMPVFGRPVVEPRVESDH
jgi:hypothetical protein